MASPKVKETALYERLGVTPNATDIEIKKAYRKQAIRLHPDKNPDDPTAHEKFQAVGEAYQILSNADLRKAYDEHGLEGAKPDSGFQDPSEMFNSIFGGEAFADWIGEISMVRDLEKSMEMSMRHEEENTRDTTVVTDANPTTTASLRNGEPLTSTSPASVSADVDNMHLHTAEMPRPASAPSSTSPRPPGIPTRLAIQDGAAASAAAAEQAARDKAAGVTDEEKQLRQKEKKKGALTKEQREELLAFELERKRVRDERVGQLRTKLLDRISLWTETDKEKDVTAAFRAKMELEAEALKMESFGLEMLHAIGATYAQKSNTFIKSHRPIIGGVSGFFSRLKDKGAMLKDGLGTVSTAISAQMEIADMAKMEEQGGDDWTDAKKSEYERRVTGKILAAAWRGSRFEIQGVLRDVCDKVLYDKNVKTEKRLERAQALQLIADVFVSAQRSAEEDNEQFVFETLVRDAAEKRKQEPPPPPPPTATASPGNHSHNPFQKRKAAAAAAAAAAANTAAADSAVGSTASPATADDKN